MSLQHPTSHPFAPPVRPTGRRTIDSPVGPLTLMGDGQHLTHLLYGHQVDSAGRHSDDPPTDVRAFGAVTEQLTAYFDGELTAFTVAMAPWGTPFQLEVWRALTTIPYASTCSYGALAARIGRPGAARAVGVANGLNPISIIVPCHRVIGASGALTGYGGGLDNKALLLGLEHDHATPPLPFEVA